MILKPKATSLGQRGLLFKRYTDVKLANGISAIDAPQTASNEPRFVFDTNIVDFIDVTDKTAPSSGDIKKQRVMYNGFFFRYDDAEGRWMRTSVADDPQNFLPVQYGTIGKYQTNAYCLERSFQFTIKGSIAGGTTQFVKGNIVELTNITIKYYDDSVNMSPDDLVVINGRLFSVEDPLMDRKMNPRPFNIYTATLNSIN